MPEIAILILDLEMQMQVQINDNGSAEGHVFCDPLEPLVGMVFTSIEANLS